MLSDGKPTVLITGGGGLVGRNLTSLLLSEGYSVCHLSRGTPQFGRVRVYRWNPEMKILDPAFPGGVKYIVHLAGANLGEKRWSEKRKKEILASRVDSARLLYNTLSDAEVKPEAFITASGISYYGTITSEKIFSENDPPADDFLGQICRKWEEAADLFESEGIRTVKVRSAVVLDKNDLALKKIMMPARFGFLAATGSGRQYMPWIHIRDLCGIYLKAIRDTSMRGAYNAASPHNLTHMEFMKTLSKAVHKPLFPVPVPGALLKLLYGEMSGIILKGSRVSSEKIRQSGYIFKFDNLGKAFEDIFQKE